MIISKFKILLIFFLIISSSYFAQNQALFTITGKVLDKTTAQPIPYVNIYLDATTLGTSTNNSGNYKIDGIPKGKYKIITSAIGYEKQSNNIFLVDSSIININFKLLPKVYKLNEVNVTAEKDYEWADNFRLFKREFLGTSDFADECKIINPEVIIFKTTKNAKLNVTATEPIQIVNYALGYKVFFEIKDFILSQNREFNYFGNIRFVQLKSNDKDQKKKWAENRKVNYKGSFKHFLKALRDNKLEDNGFQIYSVREPNWNNLRRRNFLSPNISDILRHVSNMESEIKFFNNLMVVYDDWEEEGFQKYRNVMGSNIFKTMKFQTSWISLPYSSATFDILGNIVDDYSSIKLYGYWAWLRVANLLPSNYIYGDNN